MKFVIHNLIQDIQDFILRFSYFVAFVLGVVLFILVKNNFNMTSIDYSSVANVSSVLAGFLFTAMGILFALPDNKFIDHVRKYGHMTRIIKTLFVGAIFLLISATLAIFDIFHSVILFGFCIGIVETMLSAYYLYRVTTLSYKSD